MRTVHKMKRRHRLALLVAAGALSMSASESQAVLQVSNGDFETGATEHATDVIGWFDLDTISGATEWWTTSSEVISLSPTADTGVILGDGTGSTGGPGGAGGRWLYQAIGTKEASGVYYVTLDYGQPNDGNTSRYVGIQVDIYQGTFPGAADDVDIATNGLSLISTLTTPSVSLVGEGNYTNFFSALDLSTANTTDELWIRVSNLPGSGGAWAVVDNLAISSDLPPFHPVDASPTGVVTNPVILKAVVEDWGTSFSNAIMKLDGNIVPASVTPNGSINTISYDAGSLAAGSTHTGLVVVAGMDASTVSNQWTFTVQNALTFISGSPSGAGIANPVTFLAVIADGDSVLDESTVQFYLDGIPVTYDYTSRAGAETTVSYTHNLDFDPATTHTGSVVYAGMTPATGLFTNSWTITMAGDPGYGLYIGDTNAPTPGANDVYQFVAPATDWDNIGGDTNQSAATYNDASTYVAMDKDSHQGQLFTTGAQPAYELTSVWVKHAGYTSGPGTYWDLRAADGDHVTLRIVDPSQADSAGFVLHAEDLTVVSNGVRDVSGALGDGQWYELRLKTPVALSGSKQYGFDLMIAAGPDTFFELAGVKTDPYSGGDAYTTSPRGTLNTGTVHAGNDRTFLVALTASGPTVTPDIQSIVVTGGSATLVWKSEIGTAYGVMQKTALTGGTWTEVTNVPGAGASTMATVPAGSNQEFFMIQGN